MNLTIIGTGFVGVVTAAVFASKGNQVYGLDIDQSKIDNLNQGKIPFYEPGLDKLVQEQLKTNNLQFTTSYAQAIKNADVIMIAVGTPSAPDGQADLKFVLASSESLAKFLKPEAIVVIKSTVPPGTNSKVKKLIASKTQVKFKLASIPEFLKEGSAVADTLHPDRVVIGAESEADYKILAKLHRPLFQGRSAKIIHVSPESAQMAKYAANAYLATRITFINQIADLCEKNGANVMEVIQAIGQDQRIGEHYWYPGFGYGGSCFPKDVKELAAYSRSVGEGDNLFNKINQLNQQRIPQIMKNLDQKVGGWKDKKVAVLGLSFKPQTDDCREAPSLKAIPYLVEHGAEVRGYDPMAIWEGEGLKMKDEGFVQKKNIRETVKNTDVILALIDWEEIVSFDFGKTREDKKQFFVDARNQFDPSLVRKWGYEYIGIGRA